MRNDTNHTVSGEFKDIIVTENDIFFNISNLGKCVFPLVSVLLVSVFRDKQEPF